MSCNVLLVPQSTLTLHFNHQKDIVVFKNVLFPHSQTLDRVQEYHPLRDAEHLMRTSIRPEFSRRVVDT